MAKPLFAEPAQRKSYAQLLIENRLRPRKPQAPLDFGLFSDEADQLDLCEMFQEPSNESD